MKLLPVVLVAFSLLAPSSAAAFSTYLSRLPNNGGSNCGNCHVNSLGGGLRNAFGAAFAANGRQYSASLAAQDSDGDGWTNGQELGDPLGIWTSGAAAAQYQSSPGNAAESPPDADLCGLVGWTNCDTNATCSDTFNGSGDFTCTCNAGFMGDGVTCTPTPNPCDMQATCRQDAGNTCNDLGGMSYSCTCTSGWAPQGSGSSATCADVDECAAPAACGADIDPLNLCQNLDGGYDCTCGDGFEATGSGDSLTCSDVDECAADPQICGPNGVACTNEVGGYTCSCAPGFGFDGTTCVTESPCTDGTANCDDNATCTADNSPEGFSCECEPGFEGDGVSCSDVDECADAATCAQDAGNNCSNVDGGYACQCADGFELQGSGDTLTCVAVDPCAGVNPCGSGTCVIVEGGYTCECDAGFEEEGGTCVEVDDTTPDDMEPDDPSPTEPPTDATPPATSTGSDDSGCSSAPATPSLFLVLVALVALRRRGARRANRREP